MWWLVYVVFLALFARWLLNRNKKKQTPPGTGPALAQARWRDPVAEVDPDTVVYNGFKAVPLRVQLRYTDGYGAASERTVDVQSYDDTTGIGKLEGFCHLRGERRSFYFARIERAVDAETGEIIPNLQQRLNWLWEQGTGPALRKLRTHHMLELEVLLYMAKADTAMRAAEVEVITQYCREVTGDERLDTSEVKQLLQTANLTTLHGFKIKLGQIRNPADAARTAAACRAIVATQKTVHAGERAALDYIDKVFPQHIK
ncbi:MAG: hypothetical protein ACTS8S_08165 [Giesbergeria sp.]